MWFKDALFVLCDVRWLGLIFVILLPTLVADEDDDVFIWWLLLADIGIVVVIFAFPLWCVGDALLLVSPMLRRFELSRMMSLLGGDEDDADALISNWLDVVVTLPVVVFTDVLEEALSMCNNDDDDDEPWRLSNTDEATAGTEDDWWWLLEALKDCGTTGAGIVCKVGVVVLVAELGGDVDSNDDGRDWKWEQWIWKQQSPKKKHKTLPDWSCNDSN